MKTRLAVLALLIATSATARTFMSQEQALAGAFPPGAKVVRESKFLTAAQLETAAKLAGVPCEEALVVRYVGSLAGRVVGYAYFDTHRVRTLPETLMIVITPDQRVQKIEILSFSEPPDYFPKPRWIDQLRGRPLGSDLAINRAVRPMSGSSLTGRAIVNASRKVLALHASIEGSAPK